MDSSRYEARKVSIAAYTHGVYMLSSLFRAYERTCNWPLSFSCRFLMKCANETVTIELKNGNASYLSPFRPTLRLSFSHHLYRHYSPWHHHLCITANEYCTSRRQDDPSRTRSYFSWHHKHSRIHYSLLYPTWFTSVRHIAHWRCAKTEEQGEKGSSR